MFTDGVILVTGAGGFIGGWMAENLEMRDPGRVRASVHRWSGAVRPARFPLDLILCDILDPVQVDRAVKGASVVIHCAKGASRESIVLGTRNLLEAALREGVERFVYLSSTEVYGSAGGTIDETSPCLKTGNLYGDAKIDAEEACQEYMAKGLPVTIVRPPIVYGPFSKTWTVGIAHRLLSRNWGVFDGKGEGICNLIYVTDIVRGIIALLNSSEACGETFIISGPEVLTWNGYFQRFNEALGLPALSVVEPVRAGLRACLLDPALGLARFAKDRFEKQIKEAVSYFPPAKQALKHVENTLKTSPRLSDFDLFSRQAFYSGKKAESLAGFKPRIDLDTGLQLSVAWLRQAGLVEYG
jgi:nucleoside-diphosphate-sugar epimerase